MSAANFASALFTTGLAAQAYGLYVVLGHGPTCAIVGTELMILGATAIATHIKAGNRTNAR